MSNELVTWLGGVWDQAEVGATKRLRFYGELPQLTPRRDGVVTVRLREEQVARAEYDLRDIAAKRRILALHGEPHECPDVDYIYSGTCTGYFTANECPTLRLLALPHADRPGYLDTWRPQ